VQEVNNQRKDRTVGQYSDHQNDQEVLMSWDEYYAMIDACREEWDREIRRMEDWDVEARKIAETFYVR
jgi:hypothetical protein